MVDALKHCFVSKSCQLVPVQKVSRPPPIQNHMPTRLAKEDSENKQSLKISEAEFSEDDNGGEGEYDEAEDKYVEDDDFDDGEIEADDPYHEGSGDDELEEDEVSEDEEDVRFRSAKSKRKHVNSAVNVKTAAKTSKKFVLSLKFNDKRLLSKVAGPKIKKEKKKTGGKTTKNSSSRSNRAAVNYTEPDEDEFQDEENKEPKSNKSRGKITPQMNVDEDESESNDEDLLELANEEERETDLLGFDTEDNETDMDVTKFSERQKSKYLGTSEEPDEVPSLETLQSEFYKGKKLPKSILALMEGNPNKKQLTEEEIQLRKAEAARKRKTFNLRRLEAEKKETLKKLLHRKVEKVDAQKLEVENERRLQNKLKRKDIITHKALFSWVSKTEVDNGEKKNVSYYSMQ